MTVDHGLQNNDHCTKSVVICTWLPGGRLRPGIEVDAACFSSSRYIIESNLDLA